MKEYTIAAAVAVAAALVLDRILGTRVSSTRAFRVFWVIMAALMTIVNGYLTWRPIVRYDEAFIIGIRVFTIPVEDYCFGFALITMNLVLWEYFGAKQKNGTELEL